jgi:dephospho-CoA kinase
VILIGLTGGIGAGKSTVAKLLADRGALIVDADAITREQQRAGQPVLAAIVERFGPEILDSSGELDRAGLAAIVFHDEESLRALNAIVHPAVRAEMAHRIEAARGTDRVVVLDVALLAEHPRPDLAAVVVVDVPTEVAVERLVRQRGMSETDARARIANQLDREARLARADRVIDNAGDRHALERQVDEAWTWMRTLPPVEEAANSAG